jgi:hypothetical protein
MAGERLLWRLRGEHTFAYCSRLPPKLWYVAPMALSRRNLLYLFVVDVALFVIAIAVGGNSATSADGIVWWFALLGLLLLIVLGVVALVRSRRSRAG